MRGGVLLRIAALVLLAGTVVTGAVPAGAQASPPVTTISLQGQTAYTPHPPNGGTDDYHCTLVNPHVKANSFIVSSEFYPNSIEVHHAILFLVPPALAAQAEAADTNGQGWTCFGETALPGAILAHIGETPWLSAWAPGHGEDVLPAGTGQPLPAGQPRRHADPLQPAPRRQAGARQARPAHRPRLDAVASVEPGPDAGAARHPLPGRRDRSAVQPQRLARRPRTALRRERHRVRRRPRGRLRPESRRPTRRGHHVVQLAGFASRNHRASRGTHAPPRTFPADRAEPGEARPEDCPRRHRTTTSTTRRPTTWRSPSRSCPATRFR